MATSTNIFFSHQISTSQPVILFSHSKSAPATVSRTEWMHPYFFEGKRCNLWSHADQRSLRLATHSNYLTVTRSNSREDVNIYQIISREESPPPKFSAVSQHLKPQPAINWISRIKLKLATHPRQDLQQHATLWQQVNIWIPKPGS